MPRFSLFSALAAAAVALPLAAAEPDWPQWRGPAGEGHAPAAPDLPLTWSEAENVAWKTPLVGRGWSSPVIGAGRIWVTTAVEQEATPEAKARALAGNRMAGQLDVSGSVTIRAICLDQASGKILHDVELFTIQDPQPIHKLNSFASPSPVLAGGHLYCHLGDFRAACLDAATGEELWKLCYGVLGFSIVPRPVTAGGLLLLNTSFMQPELLAVKLDGGIFATPAAVGRAIYLRTEHAIYRLEKPIEGGR